jgi:hypothetical protein
MTRGGVDDGFFRGNREKTRMLAMNSVPHTSVRVMTTGCGCIAKL